MRAFTDLSTDERVAFRAAVDNAGGAVEGYGGLFVQVAVPYIESTAAGLRAVDAIAAAHRLVREGDGHYFPLGSDNPAEGLRHPIPWKYGESRSFWFYVNYRPVSE